MRVVRNTLSLIVLIYMAVALYKTFRSPYQTITRPFKEPLIKETEEAWYVRFLTETQTIFANSIYRIRYAKRLQQELTSNLEQEQVNAISTRLIDYINEVQNDLAVLKQFPEARLQNNHHAKLDLQKLCECELEIWRSYYKLLSDLKFDETAVVNNLSQNIKDYNLVCESLKRYYYQELKNPDDLKAREYLTEKEERRNLN